MSTIHVDIVSAEAEIFSGAAAMVYAPATEGEIGIAPHHSPLITKLGPGEIRVQPEEGEEQYFFVTGGLMEVQPHLVTVLADTVERAHDLDEAKAAEAKKRAEENLADQKGKVDYARAQAELAEAAARLQTIRRLKKRTR